MNELISIDIERMIRAHLVLCMYQSSVQVVSSHKFKDPNILKVLTLIN